MKSIGIVIPAYNEKENILKLIREIRKKINCIIIVVDDSADFTTNKILKKGKIKNLKYYNRGKKSGRGSAVLFGFKKLLKIKRNINCFIEMDADLSHSPSELKRNILYFYSKSLDLLIGSRFYSKSAVKTIISKCNKTGGGFIILSEIILVLWKMNFKISEIKSTFRNRVRGESSVNFGLIIESFLGLLKLYVLKKTL